MTKKQILIDKMYNALWDGDMLMEENMLVRLPSDEISWIDDIDKVLDGEDDEGSNARDYYGDWSEEDLLVERARLQLIVIEECFETFMKRVK